MQIISKWSKFVRWKFEWNAFIHLELADINAKRTKLYCFSIYIIKIEKHFLFYHRHSELIVKFNFSLKTLQQQGISEPIFYGDLVYKFKRIVGKPTLVINSLKQIIKRYKNESNLGIMRQFACLVVNPITVYSYGFLINCTTMGQAWDSMPALT